LFIMISACVATVERLRRAQEPIPFGASNSSIIGTGMVRFWNTYTLRRHVDGSSMGLPGQVRPLLPAQSDGSM